MTTIRKPGLQFVKRIYPARIVGLGLGFFCVASVLYHKHTPVVAWALLLFHGYVWAHLAYWISSRSADPHRAEQNNLLIDSLLGGAWVVLMEFNMLPSVAIIVMMGMDNVACCGLRLLFKGLIANLIGALLAIACVGFSFNPVSSSTDILFSLPFLSVYPLVIGAITYRLSTKLAEQKRTLEKLSRTDGLTGLYNRSYWEELAVAEFWRCQRNSSAAALVLLDVDHFKRVNDEHGHAVGDEVLRGVAQLLQDNIRQIDVIGRYGGEEFAIVLPGVDYRGAVILAERLREVIAQSTLGADELLHCTISLGVAPLTDGITDYAHWARCADRALYRAKQEGRNRTVVGDASAPPNWPLSTAAPARA